MLLGAGGLRMHCLGLWGTRGVWLEHAGPRTSQSSEAQSPKRSASRLFRYTVWLRWRARQAKWWMSPIIAVCTCSASR